MGNEIPLTQISLPEQMHGVMAVTPVFVQPVKLVDNPQPVNIVGTVTVVQPITINTPIEVFGTVSLSAEPTIDIGKVDQGLPGTTPWPVSGTFTFAPSTTATTVAEAIGTTPVLLLGTNLARKGFAVQATDSVVYVKLDSTSSTALYSYELPKKGILEVENYCGPVAAVTASGSTIAMVTEKV